MHIEKLLNNRKSVRAFLNKEVSDQTITKILELARKSPSSTNTQPWEVCVIKGETKLRLENKFIETFKQGIEPKIEYDYYPQKFKQKFRDRQVELGSNLYRLIGVERHDKDGRAKQFIKNYQSFGAPVVLYFFMDSTLKNGSFLDYGMFMQTIMLAALEFDLATCAQGILAGYPAIVKEELGIGEDKYLVCGMALGYEDTEAEINKFESSRVPLENFVKFYH